MSVFLTTTISIIIFVSLFSIQLIVKAERPLRKTFTGMIKGVATLILVNVAGLFTGVVLPVSILSIVFAAVLGIPGVTTLLILNMLL